MTNGKKELEASSCQKDAVDVLVVAGRVLGGGGHLEVNTQDRAQVRCKQA